MLGGIALVSASDAAAQEASVATTVAQGAAERAEKFEAEEIAQEGTKGSNQADEQSASAPPLLWRGLIQAGLISRSDAGGEPANAFRVREAQISVEGSPIEGTHFFIEVNFPGPGEQVELNDAAVTLDVTREVRVVAGQLQPSGSERTDFALCH